MRTIAGTTWRVEDAQQYIHDRVMIVPWSGCWLWERSVTRHGYGKAKVPKAKMIIATHRLSYDAFIGSIGDSYVCHRCDVPACCNPDHLWLGTHNDNMRDLAAKGRSPRMRIPVERVIEWCKLASDGMSFADIGRAFGERRDTVRDACRRRHVAELDDAVNRCKTISDEMVLRIRAMYDSGLTPAQISKETGVSRCNAMRIGKRVRRASV